MSIIKQYKRKKKIKILSDGEQSKLITQIKNELAVKNISNREVLEMFTVVGRILIISKNILLIYKRYIKSMSDILNEKNCLTIPDLYVLLM